MIKVIKYLVILNACVALAAMLGAAWVARTAGSQAYFAGLVAAVAVGMAASLALILSYVQSVQTSKQDQPAGASAVSGVLLAMVFRMGLPLVVAALMQKSESPLLAVGFMGLLTLSYLVALPIETLMSLQFVRSTNSKLPRLTEASITK